MSCDSFYTLAENATAEFKEKGSRFLAYAYPINQEEQAKDKIQQLKKEHHSAVHWCWAIVLGHEGEFEKSSDDDYRKDKK